MALSPRFHSFSSIHEQPQAGWAWCMSRSYCKYPVIIAVVIASVVAIFTLYCCLRCCGCCGLGRRRSGGRGRKSTQPSMFNPLPYQGYQQAPNPNNPNAPPPYGHNEPARFAQFDAHGFTRNDSGNGRGGGEDSLPHMPSWEHAMSKRVVDDKADNDLELGHLRPEHVHNEQKAPMMSNASTVDLSLPPMTHGNSGHHSAKPSTNQPEIYTGPDFGVSSPGHGTDTSYGGAAISPAVRDQKSAYTGPDFFSQPKSYTAYAPSESMRYDPSGANELQEMGTTYTQQQQQHAGAPSVLQAGQRSGGEGF